MKKEMSTTRALVECAVMLAIATILSMIKIVDLPYGGSVTVACMLPVIIISYRHGLKWGLLTGVTFGIIEQLLGLNTLSWVTTWQSILAVILLDYVIAFAVTGLGGVFRGSVKNQPVALALGGLLVGVLRYACHVISGATVWAGLSIPTTAALGYSFIYNATYMIPETIVIMIVGYYIGSVLDFRSTELKRLKKQEQESGAASILRYIPGLLIAVALVVDIAAVFSQMQNGETGEFDITGLANVNWVLVIVVSAVCAAAAAVLFVISRKTATTAGKE